MLVKGTSTFWEINLVLKKLEKYRYIARGQPKGKELKCSFEIKKKKKKKIIK